MACASQCACSLTNRSSFLAGSLPLSFSLSPRQLRLITALGTGVLVGTSLIVIIPEGVGTLYSAGGTLHGHDKRAFAVVAERHAATWPAHHAVAGVQNLPQAYAEPLSARFATGEFSRTASDNAASDHTGTPESLPEAETHPSDHDASQAHREPHAWIGISLIFGFILMYLIDTLPQTSSSPPRHFQISLNQFSFNRGSSASGEDAEPPTPDNFDTAGSSSQGLASRPNSTTVGLVIHAAADGIALGASSTTSSSKLSFIIFVAVMIHKAPAAFGLTSVLLKQGLSKRMARAHLIVFSLAAPVGALLTWAAVHLLGFSSSALDEGGSAEFATGVLLLFSGGTFLYVAMHTMQESGSGSHSHDESQTNGYVDVPLDDPYAAHAPPLAKPQGAAFIDIIVTVAGMLLPLLTQWGHAH